MSTEAAQTVVFRYGLPEFFRLLGQVSTKKDLTLERRVGRLSRNVGS